MTIHIDRPDATMARIAQTIGYTGRHHKLVTYESGATIGYRSYWDGGSRDTYAVVELATGRSIGLPSNHPMFDPKTPETLPVAPGYVIVEHSIFCGKDHGLTYHVSSADTNRFQLPAPSTLTPDETTVLTYTRSFKSSYAGISNYRCVEARRDGKIACPEAWETAKAALIARKLLTAAGAITPAGRNAIEAIR